MQQIPRRNSSPDDLYEDLYHPLLETPTISLEFLKSPNDWASIGYDFSDVEVGDALSTDSPDAEKEPSLCDILTAHLPECEQSDANTDEPTDCENTDQKEPEIEKVESE